MHGKCKWCGRHFDQGGVCPSSWGFLKRNAVSHRGYDSNDIYCSEKCRAEAEAGSDESNDDDSSSSSDGGWSSSSATSESALPSGCSSVLGKLVTGVLIILGLIVIYAMIFAEKPEDVNDKEQMMKLWGEHLEKRCEAFAEGLSEESVEARGLRNYTWDEWMEFKRNGQQKPAATETAKSNEPSLRDQWLAHMDKRSSLSDSGMSESDLKKAGYPNLTFDEFKEFKKKKAEEAELERLNARIAELEGTPKTAGVARNSCSCDVEFSGDERIVTVTSEYGTRTSAWQEAIRVAVKTAVLNFVSDSNLLRENKNKLEDRLNMAEKTDIKKLDVLMDKQVGNVFTVKIRACFDKKSLAPKFKDIFPNTFTEDESTKKASVVKQQDAVSGREIKDTTKVCAVDETKAVEKQKSEEAELRSPNARLSEREGRGESGDQQRAVAPKTVEPNPGTSPRMTNDTSSQNAVRRDAVGRQPNGANGRATKDLAGEAEQRRLSARISEREGRGGFGDQRRTVTPNTEERNPATSRRMANDTTSQNAARRDAVDRQQNGASGRATKDSKEIRVEVQGKGKSRDVAMKNTYRQAVWKTVYTWVGSKARMEANRNEVISIVNTVTKADVGEYEIIDVQQQDGAYVVKAKVSVSKQKIAPKFANLFPDVFANDMK